MNWDLFKDQFHPTYHAKMRPFIESEQCDNIYKFLKKESARGKQLAPLSSNVFRCFLETPYDEVKVIICGLSPYHVFRNELPIADGLCMSCSITNYPQPSLFQFYTALENELYNGLELNHSKNPDLSYLAHQGVLLLNAGLTVEKNKAGSHNLLWEPFMKYLFEHVLDTVGTPIIFLGKEAQKLEKYTMPFNWIFRISHPASASYQGTEWDSEGAFRDVNRILKDRNNITINWLNV
jgi:uracil-DNA glycosylase